LSIHHARAERGAAIAAFALLTVVAAAGCTNYTPSEGRPSEPEAREAYFDTPLIPVAKARGIRLGITRGELTKELILPAAIEVVDGTGLDCRVYPLSGTEARDGYGSPVAAEVWFCFGRDGRLARKRWYPRHA
jgi:hypothetical protein